MEYIIIGILIVILILVVISLFKNINEGKITERLGNLENNVTRELGDFKSDISRNLNEDFNKQSERMDNKLNLINDCLDIINNYSLLSDHGIIVCEYDNENITTDKYELIKEKKYGSKNIKIYKCKI